MPLLFSYGDLQSESVQISAFGRRLAGQRDELIGFESSLVKIENQEAATRLGKTHHKNVQPSDNKDCRVSGMAFVVSEAELAKADEFESAFSYKRVLAQLASNQEVWVYAHEDKKHE